MKNNLDKIKYDIQNVGLLSIFIMFYTVFIVSMRWLVGGVMWKFDLVLSLFLSIITTYFVSYEKNIYRLCITVIIFILLSLLFIYLNSSVYGLDWDGNAYHKLAVGLIKNGWNPIRGSAEDFIPKYFGSNYVTTGGYVWLDCYGKASWIFAAAIYILTGNIETGMSYSFFGMLGLGCLLFSYLYEKFGFEKSLMVCILATCNPITLSQIYSYYNDGLLFLYFFILVLGLIQYVTGSSKEERKVAWAIIICSMPILSNIKFSGLAFGGVFCIVFYCMKSIWGLRRKNYREIMLEGGIFSGVAIVSVFVFGYATYVRNYLVYGKWVYPVQGNEVNLTGNESAGLFGKTGLSDFIFSFFGKMGDPSYKFKIPFSVDISEIYNPSYSHTYGGLGYLYSGILIITLIAILISIVRGKKDRGIFISLLLSILIIIILVSDYWLPRYIPYMYIISIFGLVLLMDYSGKPIKRFLCHIVCILFIINNVNFIQQPMLVRSSAKEIQQSIDYIGEQPIYIVLEQDQMFKGKLFDYEDNNVDYHIVEHFEREGNDGNIYREVFQFVK